MNSMRQIRLLALVVGALGASAAVHAQDFKAGFVNTDRIFREAHRWEGQRRCEKSRRGENDDHEGC